MIFARALLFCFPLIRLLLITTAVFSQRLLCCFVHVHIVAGSRIHAPPGQTRGRTFWRSESLCDHEDYIHTGRSGLSGLAITQETDGRKRIVANRPALWHGKPRNPRIITNHLNRSTSKSCWQQKKPWQSWTIIKPAVKS